MRVGLRVIITLVITTMLVPTIASITPEDVANAQGSNLLQNPRFDPVGWYQTDDTDGQIPGGWRLWSDGQPPATDYNQYLPYTRSAPGSWVLKGGYVAWTAGGYQTVAVEQGKTYRFTIYGFTWTCNDLEFSCTGPDGRTSDKSYGSKVKVGIDPTGGTSWNASTVLWSLPQDAYDAFFPVTADAVAEGSTMTVFFYTTVSVPPALRETFWDDASLVELPEGEGNPLNSGAGGEEAEPEPPPSTVPFVAAQAAQPDGSVVHVVGEGDTFDSIFVAYRSLGVTREDILALNGWDEPPRWIMIGERIRIMPPGSVDPDTGQLLNYPGSGDTSAGSDSGTGSGTGSDTGTGTDTGSDTGTGTGTGTGSDTDTGTGTDTGSDTGAGSDTGTGGDGGDFELEKGGSLPVVPMHPAFVPKV